MTSKTPLLSIALLLVLLLAACADSGDSTEEPTTAPEDPAPTATGDPTDTPTDAPTDEPTEAPTGAALDSLVSAAQEEGEVVLYAAYAEDVLESVAQGFEEEYGIDVVFQRSVTGQNHERAEQEITAGQVRHDLFSVTNNPEWEAEWDEHFAVLSGDEIPNVANLPDTYKSEKWVHVYQSYYGLVYNTDELSDEDIPQDLREMPQMEGLAGRFGTVHPAASNAYATWHAMMYDSWGQEDYEALWRAVFEDLDGRVNDSAAPLVNQVAAGELLLMGMTHYGQIGGLVAEGAPVDIAYRDPALSLGSGLILLEEAPNPNAAKLLINWLLSEDGQTILCSGQRCPSYLDIPDTVEAPEGQEFIVGDTETLTRGSELGAEYVIPFFNEVSGQ